MSDTPRHTTTRYDMRIIHNTSTLLERRVTIVLIPLEGDMMLLHGHNLAQAMIELKDHLNDTMEDE